MGLLSRLHSYCSIYAVTIQFMLTCARNSDNVTLNQQAVSVTDMQMTHGAMRTGVEAAERVLKALDARD